MAFNRGDKIKKKVKKETYDDVINRLLDEGIHYKQAMKPGYNDNGIQEK